MELWIGAINLGFLYFFIAIGCYITYKIYDFADITVDSSYTTGGAITAVLIINGINPFLSLLAAFGGGCIAGAATGIIHTKFKINGLLAGILVMTGLYSVNLRIMDKSNIPLLNTPSIVTFFEKFNPGWNPEIWLMLCFGLIVFISWAIISTFFKTDVGLFMRATGNNEIMVSANGVNIDRMKIFGISLANGLTALSGGLVAQYQGFADIGMGVGSIVFSMAAVIIGDAMFKTRSIFVKVLSVIIGSILFRLMVALALDVGLNPNDLKLITAIFVFLTLVASKSFSNLNINKMINTDAIKKHYKKGLLLLILIVVGMLAYNVADLFFTHKAQKMVKIGIILGNDSDMITDTEKGFRKELKRLGYIEGQNCQIISQNANGDIPTVSMIINNFINQNVDIFVPISTVCTQAASNLIKDKPVVFATVANPFILGVGKTDKDHPANITGVYGLAPVKQLVESVTKFFPKGFKLGVIWNPSFPNSVHNVEHLRKVVKEFDNIEIEGATITGTSEVYQAAQSLTSKNIDCFVIVPDLQVFSSFQSVEKAAKAKNIPIFTCDAERLPDGALMVCGNQYTVSGKQAANLVDEILKGKSPKDIPYEQYKTITIGINYDVAKELNIQIPDEVTKILNAKYENGKLIDMGAGIQEKKSSMKKIAVFQFADSELLNIASKGVIDQLESSGVLKKNNLKIDKFNAQSDFNNAQMIAKSLISSNYDYIITVSTISLQTVFNNNSKKIPQIFCAVTDPMKAGICKSLNEKPDFLTGLATPQPVEKTIEMMRNIFPKAKKIGIIWNPSEANSDYCTRLARKAAKRYGFELLEKLTTNVNEIEDAQKALVKNGIDILYTAGDVTVSQAVSSIASYMKKSKIPYFTNTPNDISSGSFLSQGADYINVGQKCANILIDILNGKKISDYPIELFVPNIYKINLKTAQEIGINISADIIKNAKEVIR
jgi:putative tryptophan/tyrosine transport system permease protein